MQSNDWCISTTQIRVIDKNRLTQARFLSNLIVTFFVTATRCLVIFWKNLAVLMPLHKFSACSQQFERVDASASTVFNTVEAERTFNCNS